jgi:PAS domain S-box-containing protein
MMKRRPLKSVLSRRAGVAKKPVQPPVAQTGTALPSTTSEEVVQLRSRLHSLAFLILDGSGRIHDLNETAARLLGSSRKWLIGKSFVVFVAANDAPGFLNYLMDGAQQNIHHTLYLDLTIGTQNVPVEVALASIKNFESQDVLYQLEILDRTEIRKVEQRLRETLEQFHSFVENAPDIILTLNQQGIITFANKPLLGYTAAALLGTNLFECVPESMHRKLRQCLNESFKKHKTTMCEVVVGNGEHAVWLGMSFGPATLMETATTTIVIRNITQAKRSEELLRASTDQLRNLAARVEAVREEERTRVAREIHDELGQSLTVLKLELVRVQQNPAAEDTQKRLADTIAQVDHTIDQVRRIAGELRPAILDHFGLEAAIKWQAKQLEERIGISVVVKSTAENDINLPGDVSIAAFRVVQEAITNVLRHAKASTIRIGIVESPDVLRLSIVDNGRGMTHQQMSGRKSLGLLGMKERIAHLGGQMRISSSVGKGTHLDITIPVRRD